MIEDLILATNNLKLFYLNMELSIELPFHTILRLMGKWKFLIKSYFGEKNQCIQEGLV